jgi:hypothetical protein
MQYQFCIARFVPEQKANINLNLQQERFQCVLPFLFDLNMDCLESVSCILMLVIISSTLVLFRNLVFRQNLRYVF